MLGGGTQQHHKFLPHFSLNKLSFLYWPLSPLISPSILQLLSPYKNLSVNFLLLLDFGETSYQQFQGKENDYTLNICVDS